MIKILVSCQNDDCAAETSFQLNWVRMFKGEPICEDCYDDGGYAGDREIDWADLPPVVLSKLLPSGSDRVLSMIQILAREMMKTGGAEPYDFEAHKVACGVMMKALAFLAKQEDVT